MSIRATKPGGAGPRSKFERENGQRGGYNNKKKTVRSEIISCATYLRKLEMLGQFLDPSAA